MKKYYQAVMVMAHGMSKHYSPLFNSPQETIEWVNNEMNDEKKYEYLGHIERYTTTYNDDDLIVERKIKYYYEW